MHDGVEEGERKGGKRYSTKGKERKGKKKRISGARESSVFHRFGNLVISRLNQKGSSTFLLFKRDRGKIATRSGMDNRHSV